MNSWTIESPRGLEFDDVTAVKTLMLRGSIRVVGTDGTPTRLEVSEIDRSPLIVRHHDDGTLEITHGEVSAKKIVTSRFSRHRRYRAVVSLTVASSTPVNVCSAVSSSITVAGLDGPVQVYSGQSEMVLAQLSGKVNVTNVRGRLEAIGLSGAVTVDAVSADVVLADVTGSIRAETVSGSLTLDARPQQATHLQLATVSGPVRVSVPGIGDTKVHLETNFGRISSHFPELRAVSNPGRIATADRATGVPLRDLWVRTVSGDIALLRRRSPEQVGASAPGGLTF